MTSIRLLSPVPTESMSRVDFDLALESGQEALAEFQELTKEIGEITVIEDDTQELVVRAALDDTHDAMDSANDGVKLSLTSIDAMQDTSMLIAPAIRESTRKDIALVRQVATTAAAGMGIDPSELLPSNIDDTIGQPMSLNMESFKSKTVSALKAVWRFIMSIYDYAIAGFKATFSLIPMRLRRAKALVAKLDKLSAGPVGEMKSFPNINLLTNNGGGVTSTNGISAAGLKDIFGILEQWADGSPGDFTIVLKKQENTDPEAIATHGKLTKDFIRILRGLGKYMQEDSADMVSRAAVGGASLVLQNGVAAMNTLPSGEGISGPAGRVTAVWEVGQASLQQESEYLPLDQLRVQAFAAYRVLIGFYNPQTVSGRLAQASVAKRALQAKLADIDNIVDTDPSGTFGVYLTESAAMYRALMTMRFGVVSRFYVTAGDYLDALSTYLEKYIAAAEAK